MAVKRIRSGMDVVTAARIRIKNVFSNGVPVYLSFSGGKDSLVMADIVYRLIMAGEIDPKQLIVLFVDEEAIYQSVVEKTLEWRKRFLAVGAQFQWWCVEVKHFSAYNQLTNDESYTCWDHTKADVWVRQPPHFALRNHPKLKPGIDNYQSFLPKVTGNGITLCGVRTSESLQRLQYMSVMRIGAGSSITDKNLIYPIYDWKTADVWLYLKEHKVDIPVIYLWMYQAGVKRNGLRICQLFSIDCVASLIHIAEYEPGLWERILRREPNAYLAMLYWDSELYRRNSRSRREEEAKNPKDYKALVKHMLFENPERYFTTELTRAVAKSYIKLIIKYDAMIGPEHYRRMYDALVAGDPKQRTLRALHHNIASSYADYAKTFRKGGENNG